MWVADRQRPRIGSPYGVVGGDALEVGDAGRRDAVGRVQRRAVLALLRQRLDTTASPVLALVESGALLAVLGDREPAELTDKRLRADGLRAHEPSLPFHETTDCVDPGLVPGATRSRESGVKFGTRE